MASIKINEKEKTITIVLDYNAKGELSSSGKSFVVATTNGFQNCADGNVSLGVSVNVIRKNK